MGKKKKSDIHFRTNVLLKNIIGNELINNDNIAILELVKNSFDANSKKVEISFKNIKNNDDLANKYYSNNTSKILIQDWGVGMDRTDIIDKWLNIAYSEKKNKKVEFGRVLAGAKGIGRFSCDRLGKYLDIYSKRKSDKFYVHLCVDWTKFEGVNDKNKEIQDVFVDLKTIPESKFSNVTGHSPFGHGTILEISKLKTIWAEEKDTNKKEIVWTYEPLISLKKYLEKLINPNQVKGEKNKFEIYLWAHDFEGEESKKKEKKEYEKIVNGKVENKIFTKLGFKTTSIESWIKIRNEKKILETVLKDKGKIIYEVEEDISNDKKLSKFNNGYVIIYYLNPYAKIYFKRQTGMRSVHYGSIYFFKNGFRVPPYGDEGDDWLGLELRKGQGQRRFLGTRDIVGRVEVFDAENIFKEVTSREGLVEDTVFEDLKKEFYYTTHKRLEKFVVEGIKWDSIPKDILKELNNKSKNVKFIDNLFSISPEEKNAYALDAIRSIIKTTENKIIRLFINSDLIYTLSNEEKEKFDEVYKEFDEYTSNKINKSIKDSLRDVKTLLDKKQKEIERLKENALIIDSESLFSKPKSENDSKEISELQHHINQATSRINKNIEDLVLAINENNSKEVILSYVDFINFENKKIATVSKFVTQAKFNLLSSEVKIDIIKFIGEYVENVYNNYPGLKINKGHVRVFTFANTKAPFMLSVRPIDLVFVIDNLFDNSRKAGAKRIELKFNLVSSTALEIHFKDNGSGIDKSIKNVQNIFDYGFTTTQNQGGTGIGLFHVKKIINSLGGTITPKLLNEGFEIIIKLKQ